MSGTRKVCRTNGEGALRLPLLGCWSSRVLVERDDRSAKNVDHGATGQCVDVHGDVRDVQVVEDRAVVEDVLDNVDVRVLEKVVERVVQHADVASEHVDVRG